MEESELVDLFDPQRLPEKSQRAAARWCVIVGLLCCLPDPARRPHMWKVVRMLDSCTQGEDGDGKSNETKKQGGKKKQGAGCEMQFQQSLCECRHGPHWPVSCNTARAWMDRKEKKKPNSKGAASPDDERRYREHYERWQKSGASLNEAVVDMEKLKGTWLETMATDLDVHVAQLDFLATAHEAMVECWRVTQWVHAYGYFLQGPRERERFEQLQKQASVSLGSLQVCTEKEKLGIICRPDHLDLFDVINNAYNKVVDQTTETRRCFGRLVEGVQADFKSEINNY